MQSDHAAVATGSGSLARAADRTAKRSTLLGDQSPMTNRSPTRCAPRRSSDLGRCRQRIPRCARSISPAARTPMLASRSRACVAAWRAAAHADRNQAARRRHRGVGKTAGDAGRRCSPAAGCSSAPSAPAAACATSTPAAAAKSAPTSRSIGRSTSRERIITSILQPSQEIAPDYQPWIARHHATAKPTRPATAQGRRRRQGRTTSTPPARRLHSPSADIEERHALADKSIMPDNLQSTLSIDDLRDLVTFLNDRQSTIDQRAIVVAHRARVESAAQGTQLSTLDTLGSHMND